MTELPTITKKNLKRVGIEIHEARASHWLWRGHMEMQAYLARQDRFNRWERARGRRR